MASRAKNFLEEFLFKETCANIKIFHKSQNKRQKLSEHISQIKELIEQFEKHELLTERQKVRLFSKYFDDDINQEVECIIDGKETTLAQYEEHVREVLKIKQSKAMIISDMLMETRQEKGESAKDFAKRVRIQCTGWIEGKEEIMVKIFTEGLRNRNAAFALRILQPKLLEIAISEIKDICESEITCEDDFNVRGLRHQTSEVTELKKEISKLKGIIQRLTAKAPQSGDERQYHQNFRQITCYACGNTGHIARFCKQRGNDKIQHNFRDKKCFTCGGNHLAKDCDKTKQFRYMMGQEEKELEEVSITSDISQGDGEVNALTQDNWTTVKSKKRHNEKSKNSASNGEKDYEPTLISKSRAEKARNKPVVSCQIFNKEVKVMFDTGADLNVISKELVEDLKKINPALRIHESKTKVTCANGTSIECQGKVNLSVAIGPVLTSHVFDIMPGIFPHAYIGIRSMKKFDIAVKAAEDCIEVQGIQIPFLSKTVTASSLN